MKSSVPSDFEMIMTDYFDLSFPVYLKGKPGWGKTAFLRNLARTTGSVLIEISIPAHDPTDIGGMPMLDKESRVFRFAFPEWVETIRDAEKDGKRSILFLDEYSNATPPLRAASLKIFSEGKIGSYTLPAACWRVCAANALEDSANGFELSLAEKGRFAFVDMPMSAADFINNFPEYWGNPPVAPGLSEEKWKTLGRIPVAAILAQKPEILYMEPNPDKEEAFAAPRSWEKASRVIAKVRDTVKLSYMLPQIVGSRAAEQFLAIYGKDLLPTNEELISDPTRACQIPTADAARQVANNLMRFVRMSYANRAGKSTLELGGYTVVWTNTVAVLDNLAKAGWGNVAWYYAKELRTINPDKNISTALAGFFNRATVEGIGS